MGCATSKPPAYDVDPGQVSVATGATDAQKATTNSMRQSTKYASDVREEADALTVNLVQTNTTHTLTEIYDNTTASLVLGRGACGSVCNVTKRATGEAFAMKTINLKDQSFEELRTEIAVQRRLDHPNICRIFESFEDLENREVHIIMELCTGGSLVSRMASRHRNGYSENMAATMLEKMLSAVLYCHHHGIVHRDIKLDNFIFGDETEQAELKLIDFGFACEVKEGREAMKDQLGTPSYMAPELWSSSPTYNSSVDMWALGVVAYMLLSGRRPFHHQDRHEKARMIKTAPLKFEARVWDEISQDGKDFCSALMQKKPGDRLSASEALEHPWIKRKSLLHNGNNVGEILKNHHEIIESLEAFSQADDLKKVALEVIAFATPPAKLDELRTLFVQMDEDNSGTISLAEFRKAMANQADLTEETITQMFKQMDMNDSGEVDYMEFIGATIMSQKNVNKPSLLSAFSILDRDGDGLITKEDLVAALGNVFSEVEIEEMISARTSAGKLTFADFKVLMLSKAGTRLSRVTSANSAISAFTMRRSVDTRVAGEASIPE